MGEEKTFEEISNDIVREGSICLKYPTDESVVFFLTPYDMKYESIEDAVIFDEERFKLE